MEHFQDPPVSKQETPPETTSHHHQNLANKEPFHILRKTLEFQCKVDTGEKRVAIPNAAYDGEDRSVPAPGRWKKRQVEGHDRRPGKHALQQGISIQRLFFRNAEFLEWQWMNGRTLSRAMLAREFYALIMSEESAVAWLQAQGVLQDPAVPPRCTRPGCDGDTQFITRQKRKPDGTIATYPAFKCKRRGCRSTQSVRRPNEFFTYFDSRGRAHSNLSICAILELVFLWCNDVSQIDAKRLSGHSHQAVVDWFNLCRDVPLRLWERRAGGVGAIVQMDETLLRGRRKAHWGRLLQGDVEAAGNGASETDNDGEVESNAVPAGARNYGRRREGPWRFINKNSCFSTNIPDNGDELHILHMDCLSGRSQEEILLSCEDVHRYLVRSPPPVLARGPQAQSFVFPQVSPLKEHCLRVERCLSAGPCMSDSCTSVAFAEIGEKHRSLPGTPRRFSNTEEVSEWDPLREELSSGPSESSPSVLEGPSGPAGENRVVVAGTDKRPSLSKVLMDTATVERIRLLQLRVNQVQLVSEPGDLDSVRTVYPVQILRILAQFLFEGGDFHPQ
ncbi:unnamed protein product [Darwinula stevensoni]|uniref:Uncharacterized protein n=1 Tax=Darwinula stevensoni TaxID=69355 RepID=A0A7R9A2R0_9CRUS|nr:unnamed protein product [Darwinula stevensoni]CAG0886181.1 unnamed protein product [Darwinula stevensoni]